jgi:hypothetical protein
MQQVVSDADQTHHLHTNSLWITTTKESGKLISRITLQINIQNHITSKKQGKVTSELKSIPTNNKTSNPLNLVNPKS